MKNSAKGLFLGFASAVNHTSMNITVANVEVHIGTASLDVLEGDLVEIEAFYTPNGAWSGKLLTHLSNESTKAPAIQIRAAESAPQRAEQPAPTQLTQASQSPAPTPLPSAQVVPLRQSTPQRQVAQGSSRSNRFGTPSAPAAPRPLATPSRPAFEPDKALPEDEDIPF